MHPRPTSAEQSVAASAHAVERDSQDVHFSRRWSWLILGCVALLYIGTCFTPVIFDDNEGLYAGAVREMHERGDWLLPMNNGFPRVQKPPLVYWTMLVSTSVLGENEFALRLPNALATVGWIVATYLMGRRLAGERFGLASALVLASMLGVWVFNHLIQPEPFLSCFISLSFWCLIEARFSVEPTQEKARWYFRFWIFLALGTMSKGLHGALWPLGTALLTALFVPATRAWLRPILNWRGLGVFALLVLPWYAYMTWKLPGFLQAHFVNEQIGASLNTRYPIDAKQLPIWQFYAQHLLFWLPWTLLLPAAVQSALREYRSARGDSLSRVQPVSDVVKLLGIWVALVLFSLVFSTRQDYYSMSCWGAVAMFLALPWMTPEQRSRRRILVFVPCLLIAAAGLCSLALAAWSEIHLTGVGSGSAAPIASRDTFMDAITGISPGLWSRFLALLWIFGVTAVGAGIAAAIFVWRGRLFESLLVLAGSSAVPIVLSAIGFTIMSPYFSLAENARAINRELASEDNALVTCEALPNTASSLLFYLHARVHWVNAPFNNQYAQQVLGLGRDYYLDEPALLRSWHSASPVYLIVEEDRLDYWRDRLGPDFRVVNKSGTRLVLCNRGK